MNSHSFWKRLFIMLQELDKYLKKHKSVKGFPGGKEYPGAIIEEQCDILVLAAMEQAITKGNANKIKCKVFK